MVWGVRCGEWYQARIIVINETPILHTYEVRKNNSNNTGNTQQHRWGTRTAVVNFVAVFCFLLWDRGGTFQFAGTHSRFTFERLTENVFLEKGEFGSFCHIKCAIRSLCVCACVCTRRISIFSLFFLFSSESCYVWCCSLFCCSAHPSLKFHHYSTILFFLLHPLFKLLFNLFLFVCVSVYVYFVS